MVVSVGRMSADILFPRLSLKEATVALGLLTPEEFDQKVRPERKSFLDSGRAPANVVLCPNSHVVPRRAVEDVAGFPEKKHIRYM